MKEQAHIKHDWKSPTNGKVTLHGNIQKQFKNMLTQTTYKWAEESRGSRPGKVFTCGWRNKNKSVKAQTTRPHKGGTQHLSERSRWREAFCGAKCCQLFEHDGNLFLILTTVATLRAFPWECSPVAGKAPRDAGFKCGLGWTTIQLGIPAWR